MNKGMLAIGIILLSIIALLLVNILSNFSTGSELDYYLVKETADAAMEDALDVVYAQNECGLPRIDREMFVESFLYRFAKNIDPTRSYSIKFYDISEVPPKVSVKVDSLTVLAFKAGDNATAQAADITTSYDAIMESNEKFNQTTEVGLNDSKSPLCKARKSDEEE